MSGRASSFTIEACQPEDLGEIRRILEGAPEAAMWSQESLAAALKDAPKEFRVARKGDGIVGFILGRSMGNEAEILDLAVKNEFRRAGIGTELVTAALRVYEEAGCARVFLEVRESNRGAITFYGRLGFRQVGRREGYYRQPAEAALVLAREG